MQDRFKFRCFFVDENKMYFYDYFLPAYIMDEKQARIMQCTGLKDKNGKLIYEGDIVKMNNFILQIVYSKDYACFCAENKNLIGYFRELRNINAFEVIGNIYENKELLNEKI